MGLKRSGVEIIFCVCIALSEWLILIKVNVVQESGSFSES